MELEPKYTIEVVQMTARGSLRRDQPLKPWLAQITCDGYAPGLTERFTDDTAYGAARQAAEYIVELEARK